MYNILRTIPPKKCGFREKDLKNVHFKKSFLQKWFSDCLFQLQIILPANT